MRQEYYYRQMSKPHQIAYRAMYEGLREISSEFPVLKLDNKELTDIFFKLRLDHPLIFYAGGFSYHFTVCSDYVQFIPVYMFEKKKVMEHRKSLDGRITRLVRQAEHLPPDQKEQYIHHFICEHVTYDKLKKQYSHEIIGPLQQGTGVCEGIAKSVKVLCDRMRIECIIAISIADPDAGVRYRHAWNVLKLNGIWYHFDATFDNTLSKCGEERFDYYNLDDSKLFSDHLPLLYPAPSCSDGTHFYYRENRLSLSKTEDVQKRFAAVLRKQKTHFVFHWRGGALNRSLLEQISGITSEAAGQKHKYIHLSANMAQSVIAIRIADKHLEDTIYLEEANEGEERLI